ncbi:hypothetical protein GGS23DRAFT_259867 [Durotheca rogersii]|uniref:uncharacterized protein n=1 Tax=Durotheca rogersii TaxID=419775 RepID=UPI0022211060|nr:uncharacterized protein GGS23DRAFT_259867 [Durotheca rogersii]KAI5859772.1 hypothetical protein GGS23DRAFT_259867 [Durotheca rogersii]
MAPALAGSSSSAGNPRRGHFMALTSSPACVSALTLDCPSHWVLNSAPWVRDTSVPQQPPSVGLSSARMLCSSVFATVERSSPPSTRSTPGDLSQADRTRQRRAHRPTADVSTLSRVGRMLVRVRNTSRNRRPRIEPYKSFFFLFDSFRSPGPRVGALVDKRIEGCRRAHRRIVSKQRSSSGVEKDGIRRGWDG